MAYLFAVYSYQELPMPDPPEPIFPSTFLTSLGSGLTWHSAGVNDPSGTPLGQLKDSSGATVHLCPAKDGSLGAVQWYPTSAPSGGLYGLLMTQADANKLLASGATISGGQLVSGGTTYTGQQYGYSNTLAVFKLA